jgi:hypothetical protein
MLSPAEKAHGRAWRDRMRADHDAWMAEHPPAYRVPAVIRTIRHACPARGNRSHSIELLERYVLSPAGPNVLRGRFGWLWREGRCRHCGESAISEGRLVDATARRPLDRADTEEGAPLMAGNDKYDEHQDPAQSGSRRGPTYDNPTYDDSTEQAAADRMQADTEAEAEEADRMESPDERK